jgi:hypothetical protein
MSGALARRQKALSRLTHIGAVLAPLRDGDGHGVFPRGDRRRGPMARLRVEDVQALVMDGALTPSGIAGSYFISAAGRARVAREAAEAEAFQRQHFPLVERTIVEGDAVLRTVKGRDVAGPVAQLARLADGAGASFFTGREISAARRFWEDHELGQRGLLRGSDWTAPPMGSAPRGAGGAQERAVHGSIEARQRTEAALAALPASLAAALRAFLLDETGLEALERNRGWRQRSGKLVLKLALELLADHYEAERA